MTLQNTLPTTEVSFKDFLFMNRRNRITLWLALAVIVIQFGIFKYLYPYANYIHGDSFSYINAAEKNLDINTYLIGYSKFLRLFSVFNRTDYALTAFQYLFIECSALYLLFTLFYFYKPGKITQIILLCFIIINPLFLHLGNLISSDGFFLALSLTWFTILLWIIHRPSTKLIIWHALILFIAFTVRYNALIFPILSLLAFWLSSMQLKNKLVGLGLAFMLIGSFVSFTIYKYKILTGFWQYSPFSGWQFSNNAMYAYRYVNSQDRKPVHHKFQQLDKMIREYFDSTHNIKKYPAEALQANTIYMWTKRLTLYKYRDILFNSKDSTASEYKKWASMGPYYKEYGVYIIQQYPWYFIKYFLWPNAKKYYAPPIEYLQSYNSGKSLVNEQTKNWFGYTSNKINTRLGNPDMWILNFYPLESGIINIAMISGLICYFILKGWNYKYAFRYTVSMCGINWLLNAAFTIGASSVALRFQSFPIILTTVFVVTLLDWMVQFMFHMSKEELSNLQRKSDGNIRKVIRQ